jgi:Ca2+-transporting ATPase
MILILILAGIVSFILQEWVDVWVIFAAVILNTLIGFVQEYKANKALEQIQKLVQPRSLVLRNGRDIEILAEDVVPGDLLILSMGDRVTADARLLEAIELMTNESALTGESFPVHKDVESHEAQTSLAERSNMVYTGTSIIGGRGRAVVVATGIRTELGTIAGLVEQTAQTQTPLQTQSLHL